MSASLTRASSARYARGIALRSEDYRPEAVVREVHTLWNLRGASHCDWGASTVRVSVARVRWLEAGGR